MNPSKFPFFKSGMKFLGHQVSQENIAPLPGKVDTIQNISTTFSLWDIQVFVGMVYYYRQFPPTFSELAESLVRLITNDTPFFWGEEQDSSFYALIKALASSSFLVHLNFDKPFILSTDASDVAISVILAQYDENKVFTTSLIIEKLYQMWSVTIASPNENEWLCYSP